MTDFEALLRALAAAGVEFILIGGAAATAHGSARLTADLDVAYRRTPENIARLASALKGHRAYLRGAPPGLPFVWDERTIAGGLNFTLTTDLGAIDLFGEVVGAGSYDSLAGRCVEIEVFGIRCRCVDLPTLIRIKRAAGRPKDLEVIAELEALLEEGD